VQRRRIGDARHFAAERVDFAHQLALGATADRRVASERANTFRIAGNQQRFRAQPRGSQGGLESRVTAADDDHGSIGAQ
jgi:hypothetical protein